MDEKDGGNYLTLRQMKMKTPPYKIYGMQKRGYKRKVYSYLGLPQKGEVTNKQSKFTFNETRKRRNKPPN